MIASRSLIFWCLVDPAPLRIRLLYTRFYLITPRAASSRCEGVPPMASCSVNSISLRVRVQPLILTPIDPSPKKQHQIHKTSTD